MSFPGTTPVVANVKSRLSASGTGPFTVQTFQALSQTMTARNIPPAAVVRVSTSDDQRDGQAWAVSVEWVER